MIRFVTQIIIYIYGRKLFMNYSWILNFNKKSPIHLRIKMCFYCFSKKFELTTWTNQLLTKSFNFITPKKLNTISCEHYLTWIWLITLKIIILAMIQLNELTLSVIKNIDVTFMFITSYLVSVNAIIHFNQSDFDFFINKEIWLVLKNLNLNFLYHFNIN